MLIEKIEDKFNTFGKLCDRKKNSNEDKKDDPINTSATIKTKNYKILQKKANQLDISMYQIAILCLEYLVKTRHEKLEQQEGTIQYNSTWSNTLKIDKSSCINNCA